MEEPTKFMLKALKKAKSDHKTGQVSPTFDNAKDAIAWLHNPKGRYQKSFPPPISLLTLISPTSSPLPS